MSSNQDESMNQAHLVDATDLETWASRIDARSELPHLMRRLVDASLDRITRVEFRTGEGIQLPGFDGTVVADEGDQFVPAGHSVWELSTRDRVAAKADEDYDARTANPLGVDRSQATFVFVTPRRWRDKKQWEQRKNPESVWKEVRAYDADDLEHWLERMPAVHVWLSRRLGKCPEGVADVETYWLDWSHQTKPVLTPEFLLAGRSRTIGAIENWLRGTSATLALQANSRDEAAAVFAATLGRVEWIERLTYLSRAVHVGVEVAWTQLIESRGPLILLQGFESADAVSQATRRGHRVVVFLGRADAVAADVIRVDPLDRGEAAKVLMSAGVEEEQARVLAKVARRSMRTYRRSQSIRRESLQPSWAQQTDGPALVPALLAGGWSDSNPKDRAAVAALAQTTYESLQERLVQMSNTDDPPIHRVGDAWRLIWREDAWELLNRYLTADGLSRFGEVTLTVLGTIDPRFDLPKSRRWLGRGPGTEIDCSDILRKELADTLAMLTARGESLGRADIDPSDTATRVAQKLLAKANTDWRLWASLERQLPLLAEAAPDVFLDALEEGLSGQQPVLEVFRQEGDGLFGSAPHTGILWALETIAWSPEYLGRAAHLLAKLARLEPGGRVANRPHRSLREIFLLWHPQTSATLERRLRVLDTIRDREPTTAWRLLVALQPASMDAAHPTHTPAWRDWAPDRRRQVSHAEFARGISGVVHRLLEDVGDDGTRWADIIGAIGQLPRENFDLVVSRLSDTNVEVLQPSARLAISDALRDVIAHHRSFPDAEWVMTLEQVDRLEDVWRLFEPTDLVDRYTWLFSSDPQRLEGRGEDYEAEELAIEAMQLGAARTIYDTLGVAGLMALVEKVERPEVLGGVVGRSDLCVLEERDLLRDHLACEGTRQARFAAAFAWGRTKSRDRNWTATYLADDGIGWTDAQRTILLSCLPYDRTTWDLVTRSGQVVERQYWKTVNVFWVAATDVEFAVQKLLDQGQAVLAVALIHRFANADPRPTDELIAAALEAFVHDPNPESVNGLFGYHVAEFLRLLNATEVISEERRARLEWLYLPLLEHEDYTPKLLQAELARNPEFFAEVLAIIYRAQGDERQEASAEESARARHGDALLNSWNVIPGTSSDGHIDGDELGRWVRRARELIAAQDRAARGDLVIGGLLSTVPQPEDGAWPPPGVCAIFERCESKDLERGFEVAIYNSRGVYSKGFTQGGRQERDIAARYDGFAIAIADSFPRSAAMLRRIATRYRSDGKREDRDGELRSDLY